MPIISANTQSRAEGCFRREWNLAVARTLDNAEGRPFLLPIVIDGTSELQAVVPFVNMSGDKEQDYFSNGLSEELLNSLVFLLQGRTRGSCDHRAQVECRVGSRGECATIGSYGPRDRTAQQCGHGVSPLVTDL